MIAIEGILSTMRTNLNLSRRPFTNRRLFWLSVFVVLIMSFGLALWVASEQTRLGARITDLNQQITQKSKYVNELVAKQAEITKEVPQTVLDEQQVYELASARILVARKGFSWNRLLSDIESHVPQNVRLLSIKIEEGSAVKQASAAAIEVKAMGKQAGQMTEMMQSLEKSGGVFELDQAIQDAVSESSEVPFTLKLLYRPVRGGA
jgi:Tfp pilus assembly protein PilN